ncbi:HNH endonuclease [Aquipuribacter hungaricus]|uniref:HNH endonuclease n=2 Tax=Aquipuribacter hungaricus TaxID=545624 RepID=A0ABV7WDR5_9MICO
MKDSVPVGVLRERSVSKGRRPEYDVLGLAVPVDWRDGYFFFESVTGSAGPRGDTAGQVLTASAEDEFSAQLIETSPPEDDYDARRRVYRQIVARRGQVSFRRELLDAYQARCAITGSSTTMVLEAAHLRPYRGPRSNSVSNGLLLRSDLHTLLDLQLLAFDPTSRRVLLSRVLSGGDYADLAGRAMREPTKPHQRPADDVLAAVHAAFQHAEGRR